jgi:hypothetical protein
MMLTRVRMLFLVFFHLPCDRSLRGEPTPAQDNFLL